MSYFLSAALVTLRAEVDARSPNRSRASDGWIGDPAHASRHSDHNPEPDGSVDAIDITHDPANGVDCSLLADEIKDDPRVSYLIWNHHIWNPSISKTWRTYTGSNPHTKHMHVSVSDRGQNDTRPWLGDTPTGGLTMDAEVAKAFHDTRELLAGLNEAEHEATQKVIRKAIWNSHRHMLDALREGGALPEENPDDDQLARLGEEAIKEARTKYVSDLEALYRAS